MMAGNPNWWSINTMHPQSQQLPSAYQEYPPQYLYASSPSNSTPLGDHHPTQEFPRSLSQLLLGGGLANDPERTIVDGPNCEYKKLEIWEGQMLNPSLRVCNDDQVKLEVAQSNQLLYGGAAADDEFQIARPPWSQVISASSSSSCVTSLSSSLLNFSNTSKVEARNQHPETSSECNSSRAGNVAKKPKIQHSTTQPAMKVRKEKLGDRITALHQLVSPFGKTDTASVLSESIGYIRFLQAQIQALSSPYLGNAASRSMGLQQSSECEDQPKDLRSRGLCLVPVSCTLNVGSDNGADYWAPALGGGF